MGNEEEQSIVKDNDHQPASNIADDPSGQRVGNSPEIVEETSPSQHCSRQEVNFETQSRTLEDAGEDFVRINIPLTPTTPRRVNFSPTLSPSFAKVNDSLGTSSSRSKATFKSLLPRLSFKSRNTTSDIEKAAIQALDSPFAETREKPQSMHGEKSTDPLNFGKGTQLPIHRSRSVPVLNEEGSIGRSIVRSDSLLGVFRVIPTTPPMAESAAMTPSNAFPSNDTGKNNDGGEDILEEEAVCRICLIELGEGADTLKMECSCKGALALAHQECAVKWFSLKGNKTCDVCKQEVQNLPVTLLRLQSVHANTLRGNRGQQVPVARYRVWQDIPVLVIVSMLAYFSFLEQLLVGKMKSGAIAISLPFSCILGLLASMTATTMVGKKYVWLYALIQFGLVVLSAHIFYSLFHMQAVLSVLLSTFAGFGITMSGTSALAEVLKQRRAWLAQRNQQRGSQEVIQPDQQQSTSAHQSEADPQQNETEIRDSQTGTRQQPT
ncbi:RING/U-box superfamily protein [Melia azedarach]|uniref:RING/U-box superfamily protein n=1 Tax=Melia azedarach TaxID=155640 RepID=A0ACC1X1W5_MELAZ|nr:RING/U-box superfamily protein [Melia azedarach]